MKSVISVFLFIQEFTEPLFWEEFKCILYFCLRVAYSV